MSTSSWIGIENKDKTIRAIYCHSDGYVINGVGETLVKNYTTPETVAKLLDLGELSRLGTKPVENLLAWDENFRQTYIHNILSNPAKYHEGYELQHPADKCDCYKTRGDARWQPWEDKNETEYLESFCKTYNDYCYLFKDGEWYFASKHSPWQKVKEVLEEE